MDTFRLNSDEYSFFEVLKLVVSVFLSFHTVVKDVVAFKVVVLALVVFCWSG